MTIIRLADQRAVKVCRRARFWFERHGLDWHDYVKNGIHVDKLRAIGDSPDKIDNLEAAALAREARERGEF